MDVKKYIDKNRKILDGELKKYLPLSSTKPSVIHKAMRYSVLSGGKRIRPVFSVAAFEACGGKGRSILPVACGIELIHAYTLVHDDLPCMDDDDLRRGKQTCHKKFGEAMALLTGDALLTLGFELLSKGNNANIIKEAAKATGSLGTIGGQVVDALATRDKRQGIRKKELDYIVSNKTGKLFEAALVVGGMTKKVGEKKIKALRGFGKCVGFTFQLVDDLMDKDGYVAVYGEQYVRKTAKLFTERAKSYLTVFGKKSKNLFNIADFILNRKF